MIKFILLVTLFISAAYSQRYCDCGTSHTYNKYTNTCVKTPTPNQEGYVPECKNYIVIGKSNSWRCTKCNTQYRFKTAGECEDTGIPGCVNAQKLKVNNGYEFRCLQCDENNYYLKHSQCIKYPTKGEKDYILGCQKYLNRRECLQCEQGYYNKDNYCKKVQNLIPNCVTYNSNEQCQKCKSGFIVDSKDNCVEIRDVFQNCKSASYSTYYKKNICSSCYPEYYFDVTVNKCKPNPTTTKDGKIDHCEQYYKPQGYRLRCSKCNTQYSLNNLGNYSVCEGIQGQKVNNCYSYDTTEEHQSQYSYCTRCKSGYFEQSASLIEDCIKCPANPDKKQNFLKAQNEEYSLYEYLQSRIDDILNIFI